MRDAFCPKCDEVVTPKWHARCSSKKSDVNYCEAREHQDTEHLHYFCRCGYDFVASVDEDTIVEL